MLKTILLMGTLLVISSAWSQAPDPAAVQAVVQANVIRYPVRDADYPAAIELDVDASDLQRHIIDVHERIPVSPGPLTLLYPEWVPGKHGPRGSIDRLAGLKITAAGMSLPWRRNSQDMYAFTIEIPAGVTALDVQFQYLSPVNTRVGALEASPELLMFNWYTAMLYPMGYASHRIPVQAKLKLPTGFTLASALQARMQAGWNVFESTSTAVLFDSPVFAGMHAKRIELTPRDLKAGAARPVFLNVFADNAALLEITDAQVNAHRKLVREAITLFGSQHYDHYDFLLHLSSRLVGLGVEHHRSSENVAAANYFTDWQRSVTARALLPHEFVHSWNGKFRMPAAQVTPHFNTPYDNGLMWIYEGQTQYWGEVLAARSGLRSRQQALDSLAMFAAAMQRRVGREWRALLDTTNDPIFLARRAQSFASWQRNEDYYNEGLLIWLEADTRIRELSRGKRSLDDFAKLFFGVRDGSWQPMPYGLADVITALNTVQPDDWQKFFNERVQTAGQPVPFDGLTRAGYKLVFDATPTDYFKASEEARKVVDLVYSIGCILESGRITETQWQSPAFHAGLVAGDEIVAVQGEAFTGQLLKEAIVRSQDGRQPIELLIKNDTRYRIVQLNYAGGLRYPKLERIDTKPALLDSILTSLTGL